MGPKLLPKRIVKNGDTLHGLFAAAPTEMQENMSYYVPIRIAALAGSSPEDLDIEVTHEGWGLTVEYKTPSFYRDAKLISKVEATFAGISAALTSNLHEALARLEIEQPTGIQRHTYKLPMKCKKDVVDFKFFDDGKHQHYRIILEVLDASMAKKVLKIKAEAATGPPPPPNVGSDDSA